MSGTPCFRGTRVPFQTLLDYLEGGETLDEFLDQFPTVTRNMAVTALNEAKESLLEFGPPPTDTPLSTAVHAADPSSSGSFTILEVGK